MSLSIPDLDLVWIFSFDLGKSCDPEQVTRHLSRAGLAIELLRFDETGRPRVTSLVKRICQDESSADVNPPSAPEIKMLEIMGFKDLGLFYEEYRRSHSYIRLKLRGFEITFPELQSRVRTPIHCEAYALIHKAGFAVMSFWMPVRGSTLDLADLVILERPDGDILRASVWRGLVEQRAKVSVPMREMLTSGENQSSQLISVVGRMEGVRNLYAFFIETIGVVRDVSSIEELEKKLRYYPIASYPVMAIRNVGGASLESFVSDHKFELHGILAKERHWDWVGREWVEDALRRNLAWRSDWAVFINHGASLLMMAPGAAEKFLKVKALENLQNADGSLELQFRAMDLDVVNIVEVLQLQQIMLRTYDYMLSVGLPSSLRGLTDLKQSLTQGLDEYHNVRIWPHKTAQEWVEFGQRVMNIDKIYDVVRTKLDLLEGKLRTQYDIRLNSVMVALIIFFGSLQVGQLVSALGWSQLPSVLISLVTLALGLSLSPCGKNDLGDSA